MNKLHRKIQNFQTLFFVDFTDMCSADRVALLHFFVCLRFDERYRTLLFSWYIFRIQ